MTISLETKFEILETQLATQHTAISNALDSILTAMGAPPPTATVTLATISTQLNALNNNLIGIAIANGSFHSALLSSLDLLNTNVETMLTNNSLNAQRLLQAIYATFCPCPTDVPLLTPPLDVTPTELVDEAKCRRIQFYLSVFGNWLNKIANYGASGASITGGTLAYLLNVVAVDAGIIATGAEVGAAGGPPGIVIGAVVGLIIIAVYTYGGSVLIDYANEFNDATLRDNMVQAMYAATNADEGYTAFKSTLLAGMSTIPAEIIYTLWWSAWSNDIYSGTPAVDDSAFDGSICAPPDTGCVTLTSTVVGIESRGGTAPSVDAIIAPSGTPSTDTITFSPYAPYVFDEDIVFLMDAYGYTVQLLSGSAVDVLAVTDTGVTYSFSISVVGTTQTIAQHTASLIFTSSGMNTGSTLDAFSIEFCAPV